MPYLEGTYFEVAGDGDESVVLLHGGYATAIQWRHQIAALSERHRVFAPERSGHGRTPDREGPVSYELYAADTVAFLESAGIDKASLIGHSDGAIIAILVALERPDLVEKLVPMGVYVNRAGILPGVIHSMDGMRLERSLPFEREQYEQLSPDGADHWPVVFEKIARMWREEPDIPTAALARIDAPTLILQSDDDVATHAHLFEMFETLPNAQLAIVPGTSHAFFLEKPDLVNRILLDFLAGDQVTPWMPFRRAEA